MTVWNRTVSVQTVMGMLPSRTLNGEPKLLRPTFQRQMKFCRCHLEQIAEQRKPRWAGQISQCANDFSSVQLKIRHDVLRFTHPCPTRADIPPPDASASKY